MSVAVTCSNVLIYCFYFCTFPGYFESVCPSLLSSLSLYFPLGSSIQQQPTTSLSTMNLSIHAYNAANLTCFIGSSKQLSTPHHQVSETFKHSPDLKVNVGFIGLVALGGEVGKFKTLLKKTLRRGNHTRHCHGDAQEVKRLVSMIVIHTLAQIGETLGSVKIVSLKET